MIGSHNRSGRPAPKTPGSPETPDSADLVVVGRVRRPTGIDGTLLVEVYSGSTDRFSAGDRVIVGGAEYEIVRTGKSGKSAKVKLAGINSIEEADPFRDEELAVNAKSLPENPPGIYYHYEILGTDVVTVEGQKLGTLTEIIETGSNDVFVVSTQQSPGKRSAKTSDDILIPVLDGVIVKVDAENGVMTIDPPAGLF
jgi:16S rRNA processing protein RimM